MVLSVVGVNEKLPEKISLTHVGIVAQADEEDVKAGENLTSKVSVDFGGQHFTQGIISEARILVINQIGSQNRDLMMLE
jgi:hypothetical protein